MHVVCSPVSRSHLSGCRMWDSVIVRKRHYSIPTRGARSEAARTCYTTSYGLYVTSYRHYTNRDGNEHNTYPSGSRDHSKTASTTTHSSYEAGSSFYRQWRKTAGYYYTPNNNSSNDWQTYCTHAILHTVTVSFVSSGGSVRIRYEVSVSLTHTCYNTHSSYWKVNSCW